MVVLSRVERRELARIEEELDADPRLAELCALFATAPSSDTGRGAPRSADPPGKPAWPWTMPAPPGVPARPAPGGVPRDETSRARTASLARMKPIAGLIFCAVVGLLAVGLLTASLPVGTAMLLLAPLIALATIVALRGALAAAARARRRRGAVGGSLRGGVTGR
jgi:hypothetical protein